MALIAAPAGLYAWCKHEDIDTDGVEQSYTTHRVWFIDDETAEPWVILDTGRLGPATSQPNFDGVFEGLPHPPVIQLVPAPPGLQWQHDEETNHTEPGDRVPVIAYGLTEDGEILPIIPNYFEVAATVLREDASGGLVNPNEENAA